MLAGPNEHYSSTYPPASCKISQPNDAGEGTGKKNGRSHQGTGDTGHMLTVQRSAPDSDKEVDHHADAKGGPEHSNKLASGSFYGFTALLSNKKQRDDNA